MRLLRLALASVVVVGLGVVAPTAAAGAITPANAKTDRASAASLAADATEGAPDTVHAAAEAPPTASKARSAARDCQTAGPQERICAHLVSGGTPALPSSASRAQSRTPAQTTSGSEVLPLQDWCIEGLPQDPNWASGSADVMRRLDQCSWRGIAIDIHQTVNGVDTVVGSATYDAYGYSYTSYRETQWNSQLQIIPRDGWGRGTDLIVDGEGTCYGWLDSDISSNTGGCYPESQEFPPTAFYQGEGDAVLEGGTTATFDPAGDAGHFWSPWNMRWFLPETPSFGETYWQFYSSWLCDNLINGRPAGCITSKGYSAGFVNPTFEISLTGPDYEVAEHIQNAQAVGIGTPIGSPDAAQFFHTSDQATIDANRAVACPTSLPRPTGKSCDEFPFASTVYGAAFFGAGAGTTFPGCGISDPGTTTPSWSHCMVDAAQNSHAGSLTGAFYYKNRVSYASGFNVAVTP